MKAVIKALLGWHIIFEWFPVGERSHHLMYYSMSTPLVLLILETICSSCALRMYSTDDSLKNPILKLLDDGDPYAPGFEMCCLYGNQTNP